jgi:hypothetical protein
MHYVQCMSLVLMSFVSYYGAAVPVGQGFLIIESSQSHAYTPHSVGLLWTSDQPVAETSD